MVAGAIIMTIGAGLFSTFGIVNYRSCEMDWIPGCVWVRLGTRDATRSSNLSSSDTKARHPTRGVMFP